MNHKQNYPFPGLKEFRPHIERTKGNKKERREKSACSRMAHPWTASRIGAVHLNTKNLKEKGEKHSSHPIDTITIESKMKRELILKQKEELL